MRGILKFHHCDITETKTFCLLGSFFGMHFLHRFWMISLGYFQRSYLSTFILHFVFWINFLFLLMASSSFTLVLFIILVSIVFLKWLLLMWCFLVLFVLFSGTYWRGASVESEVEARTSYILSLFLKFHDWFDQHISQTNLMPLVYISFFIIETDTSLLTTMPGKISHCNHF